LCVTKVRKQAHSEWGALARVTEGQAKAKLDPWLLAQTLWGFSVELSSG
jgi:hypothetical protein